MSNEIFQTSARVDINLDDVHRRITHLYPGGQGDVNKEQFIVDRRDVEPGVDWGLKDRERILIDNKKDESKTIHEHRNWNNPRDDQDCHKKENQATNLSCDGIKNEEVKREDIIPIAHSNVSDSQTVITSSVCKAENSIYSHQNYAPIKTEPFQEFVQKYERPDFNYPPPPPAPPAQYMNSQGYYYDNYPPPTQIPHANIYNQYNPPAPYTPSASSATPAVENKEKSHRGSTSSSPTESQLLRLQRHRDSQALRRLNPEYRRAEQEADRQRKRIRRANPEYRRLENARNSMRNRIRRSDPVYRAAEQKIDAIRKRLKRNDPEYRKKEQERNNIRNRIRRMDPEYREAERIRSANRKRIKRSDPEYRKREQELDRERKKRKKLLKKNTVNEELDANQIPSGNQIFSNQTNNTPTTTTAAPSNVTESKTNISEPEQHQQSHEQHHQPHEQQHQATHHHQQQHHIHHQHPISYPPPSTPLNRIEDESKIKFFKIGDRQFPQIPPPISHIYSLQRNFMENFHPSALPVPHHHHHPHHHVAAAAAAAAVAAGAASTPQGIRHNFRNFDGENLLILKSCLVFEQFGHLMQLIIFHTYINFRDGPEIQWSGRKASNKFIYKKYYQ